MDDIGKSLKCANRTTHKLKFEELILKKVTGKAAKMQVENVIYSITYDGHKVEKLKYSTLGKWLHR